MNGIGKSEIALWNEADGFYYDVLDLPDGQQCPMKVRSLGLIRCLLLPFWNQKLYRSSQALRNGPNGLFEIVLT